MTDHPNDLEADLELEPSGAEAQAPARDDGPHVFIMETALRELMSHAAEEPEHEVGGILVGSVVEGERPVVFVEACIRGTSMTSTRGSVTFTHETWNNINNIKDEKHPDLKIVGWYHSHPGFGLFLSGHDLFIHRNFFTAPWQVAVVSDPLANTWGCFTWHGQELGQEPNVHTVEVRWQASTEPTPATAASAPPPVAPVIVQADSAARPGLGVTVALGMLATILLTILLVLVVTAATYYDTRALRQELAELTRQSGSIAHELAVVRERLHDVDQHSSAPTDGSPPGSNASPAPQSTGEILTPLPSPPPAEATDGRTAP